MMKKSLFITLLCAAFAPTAFGMEPEHKTHKKSWLKLTANSLMYATKPIEKLFFQDPEFDQLPLEEQAEVFLFLNQNNRASTIESIAQTVNSIAKINEQLDTLINNPKFCLTLIKRLGLRFDCSHETAALALQTKEAQRRLTIQKKFELLFSQSSYIDPIIDLTELEKRNFNAQPMLYDFSIKKFKKLYNQYKNYIDLDFTYQNFQDPRYDDKDTLLINSVMYPSPYKTDKIISLLQTNRVNINYRNAEQETALLKCAQKCDNPAVLKLLCDDQNILIDLSDKNNNTALMKACLIKVSPQKETREKSHKAICIALLLRAGADPEKVNIYGQTPLMILKNMGDNEKEIKLIKDAIQKRHDARAQENIESQKVTKTKKSHNKK